MKKEKYFVNLEGRKGFSIILACAFLFILSLSVYGDNPIFTDVYTADPSAYVGGDGRLYVVCTHDQAGAQDYNQLWDYYVFSSSDMVNWRNDGIVFDVRTDSSWAGLAYAPSMAYRNGTYFLYYPNGASSIGVATSSSPTGRFRDVLGRAMLDKNVPNGNVEWCFDPCIFIDDDGQAYMYYGGGGPGNARVIRVNSDLTSVSGSAVTINAPRFFEAAYMHKRNGIYYFSYSSDFSAGAATIEYMTSSDPMTGFQHRGTILGNPWDNLGNNNHHSIVEYKGQWYIFYHNRALSNAVYQRSVCVDYLYHNSDGTIRRVIDTREGVDPVTTTGDPTPAPTPTVPPVNRDAFSTIQAESYDTMSGIQSESCGEGGQNIGYIENGDWSGYGNVDFGIGAGGFEARVASNTSGGSIEIRLDSSNGTLVGTCSVPGTGGWQTWTTVSGNVSGATGLHDLYLRYTGGSGYLFNVNWFTFTPGGVQEPTPVPTAVPTATPTPAPTQPPATPDPTATPVAGGRDAFSTIQAESYDTMSGIQSESCSEGGENIGYIENGDWSGYGNVDFGTGAGGFEARVASNTSGGSIEIRLDSSGGTLVGTCSVPGTGGWQTWTTVSCNVSGAAGTHDLYLRYTGGSGYLFNVNWFTFTPGGVTEPTPTPAGGSNVLEVELESLSSQGQFPPFVVTGDSAASGGQAIQWPDNGNAMLSSASDSATGQVLISFTLSQAANVQFQIRVNMSNASNDSFYYKMDSGSWTTQNNTRTSGYELLSPSTYNNLSAGSHTLRILRREDGTLLDTVILTASGGSIY